VTFDRELESITGPVVRALH